MGYGVDMDLQACVIPRENVKEALKEAAVCYGERGDDLADLIECWGYQVSVRMKDDPDEFGAVGMKEGDVLIESFIGDKLGDDHILWKSLTPYLREGWEVRCVGEDGYHWRWCARNGVFREDEGQVTYIED